MTVVTTGLLVLHQRVLLLASGGTGCCSLPPNPSNPSQLLGNFVFIRLFCRWILVAGLLVGLHTRQA